MSQVLCLKCVQGSSPREDVVNYTISHEVKEGLAEKVTFELSIEDK